MFRPSLLDMKPETDLLIRELFESFIQSKLVVHDVIVWGGDPKEQDTKQRTPITNQHTQTQGGNGFGIEGRHEQRQ